MDLQSDKQRLVVLLVTSLAAGAAILCAGETEDVPVEKLPPAVNEPETSRRPVQGLALAQASSEVRNPFTLMHETAAEQKQMAVMTDGPPPEPALSPPSAALPSQQSGEAEPELCGIMQTDNCCLALLRIQGTTVALAAGEVCQSWRVVMIDQNGVVVQKGGLEKRLVLPLPALQ